jgi:hypothetical protein
MSAAIKIRDLDEHNFEIELTDGQGQLRRFRAGEMYQADWSLVEVTSGMTFFIHGPLVSKRACVAAAKRHSDAHPPEVGG